jgi:hypothetical protein
MPPLTDEQVTKIAGLLLAARDLPPCDWESEPDPEIRWRRAMCPE